MDAKRHNGAEDSARVQFGSDRADVGKPVRCLLGVAQAEWVRPSLRVLENTLAAITGAGGPPTTLTMSSNRHSIRQMMAREGRQMDRTVARLNIEHYRRLLAKELDEAKRRTLQRLMAEEEAKMAGLEHPEGDKKPQV